MSTGMGPLLLCFVLIAKSSITSGLFMPPMPAMPPMPSIPPIQFPSTFPFNNGGSFNRINSFNQQPPIPFSHQSRTTITRLTPAQITNFEKNLNKQADYHANAKQMEKQQRYLQEKEMDRQEKQMDRQRERLHKQLERNEKQLKKRIERQRKRLAKKLARKERKRQREEEEEMARLKEQEKQQVEAIEAALREVNWDNVKEHVKEFFKAYNMKVEDIPVKVAQSIPSDTRETIMNALKQAQKMIEDSLNKTENGKLGIVADDKMVQTGKGIQNKRVGNVYLEENVDYMDDNDDEEENEDYEDEQEED